MRGKGTHRKQAPRQWEARGLAKNKNTDGKRQGDSPKTSTPMVKGKGTQRKQAPRWWEARGLAENKYPNGERQEDSTKTSISTVRGKEVYFRGQNWGLRSKKMPLLINHWLSTVCCCQWSLKPQNPCKKKIYAKIINRKFFFLHIEAASWIFGICKILLQIHDQRS